MSSGSRRDRAPGEGLALASAAAAGLSGLAAMTGLLFASPLLSSFLPGAIAAHANTAGAALVAALALGLRSGFGPRRTRPLLIAAGALVLVLAVHGLFATEPAAPSAALAPLPSPGPGALLLPLRLSPLEAASYAILGLGCLSLPARRRSFSALAGVLAFASGYLSFASHVYGVRQYGFLGSWAEMSFPSTLSLMALGVALLALTADRRPAAALTGEGSGARLLRNTTFLVFALPLAIGFLVVGSVRSGAFDLRFGGAVSSLLSGLTLAFTLYGVAKTLERGDEKVAERTARLEAEIEERRQVEEELRKVTRAVEQSPVAVIITDAKGAIEYANAKFCAMSGYGPEEVIGRNPRILNSGHQPKSLYAELWKTVLAGGEWHGVFRNRRKDGSLYWASASISPIRGQDGGVDHFVGMTEDISALKAAEDSLRDERNLLRTLVDAVPDSIIVKDEEGRVLLANEGAARFFGVGRSEELLGRRGPDYLGRKLLPDALQDDRDILSLGRSVQREEFLEDSQGGRRWFSLTKLPVSDEGGRPTKIVALARDITLAKTVEESLEKARASAELARAEAESMSAAKSEFLANMSHEIRTPMNAIIGMAQLLGATGLTGRQRDLLARLSSSADLLLEIINDILDISKIESGRMQLEATVFRVSELVSKVEMIFSQKMAEKGLFFATLVGPEVPDFLVGDPLRLRQVLLNLVGNAVKFTAEGRVQLEVERVSEAPGAVLLRFLVSDTGMGIDPEVRSRLFLPFSQADSSTTRRYGGTGLGLAISKSLVQAMGGEISVESEPGRGSVFCFTARFGLAASQAPLHGAPGPEAPPPEAARAELLPEPGHLAGLRILLVEDNRLNILVAREMLLAGGALVEVAKDGEEALRLAEAGSFDVVLMDVQMPGISGYEAARRIHAMEGRSGLPIVAVTANAMAQDREKAFEAGMCFYLTKPFRYGDLVDAITRCAEPSSAEPAPRAPSGALHSEGRYAEADATFAALDGIDVREGIERAMGNPLLFVRMLKLFGRDLAEALAFLEGEGTEDLDAAARLAHSLKGEAGNVGARALGEAAAALESACREGRRGELQVLRGGLKREVERIRLSTSVLLAEEPLREARPPEAGEAEGGAGPQAGPSAARLEEIARGLEEGSAEALDLLLRLLPDFGASALGKALGPEDLGKLRLLAETFRLDEAAALLRRLIGRLSTGS